MRRIEALPVVRADMERAERRGPVLRAAMGAARSSSTDAEATTKLRERVKGEPSVVREVLDMLDRRDSYVDDRAYRLLEAAFTDDAVAAIPPERAVLFGQEEAIGRMPIEQAFGRLAEAEPRLLDLEREAQRVGAASEPLGEGPRLPKLLEQPLPELVGAEASSKDKLLRTSLASSVVRQYLRMLAGDTRLGSSTTAYFDSPMKVVHFP